MIERYSNPEISSIWKLDSKYKFWLEVELAVCRAWQRRGVIPQKDLESIEKKATFQRERIAEIEEEVQHDMIAFLSNLRENIGPAGRYVHYGLTSSDVGDTALNLQIHASNELLLKCLDKLIANVAIQAKKYKGQAMIGRTHGIHGEPTTLGLKLALFYAELQRNRKRLVQADAEISVGKLSGAVGTFSNIDPDLEAEVCQELKLEVDPITTQVVGRDRHAFYCAVLGIVAGSLERMAQEIRLLQKSEGREVEEPFSKGQKGSSAMPHKRNPVICERICGLARVIQANVQVAYRNIPLWHERDISHSSAERVILPDSIISLEYLLDKMDYVISNLHVYPENMQNVLETTRGLLFSQRLLLNLIEKGMEREDAYSCVQAMCMDVWADKQLSLAVAAKKNPQIMQHLNEKELSHIFELAYYLRNIDKIFERVGLGDRTQSL